MKTLSKFVSLLLTTMVIPSVTATNALADPITNPNYEVYPDVNLINRDLGALKRVYRRNYHKYIDYKAPNGKPILLVANKAISDEQLLRAYNILDFYLTDVPQSTYGKNKSAIANHMANKGAVLVMPDGADGESKTWGYGLSGQPLYELEFPTEGSNAYVENDYRQRDAGFEEIFHMVHDYGIGTKYSLGILKNSFQVEITKAMESALNHKCWGNGDDQTENWIRKLKVEGSLEQEYIAAVIDSYYGLWGAYTESDGGMGGIYIAKTRADIDQLDPSGTQLMEMFLPTHITYMARIDPHFKGTFSMSFNSKKPYTHKSQYLLNARLLGTNNNGLIGNEKDNILIGNTGNNKIDGQGGKDTVQYNSFSNNYDIDIVKNTVVVTSKNTNEGTDILLNIETLRFKDMDVQF